MQNNRSTSGARRHSSGGRPSGGRSYHSSRNTGRSGGNRSGGGRGGKKGGKQYIAPHRFVNRATERAVEAPYEPTNTFADFKLHDSIKRTLDHIGYTTPSAIQDQSIPLILEGHDVIGLANTGTGKTAAFLLPIIEKLIHDRTPGSVLIMAPTRELAQQIDAEFRRFAAGLKLYSAICVGGVNIGKQIRELQRGPHIIIGTPGRLKDLIQRRALRLNATTFVLDEADRMLDMGFVADIRAVAELLPRERQTLCFSATITPAIEKIVQDFMHEPKTVSVRRGETSEHIEQDIVESRDKFHKLELLTELLRQDDFQKVIVFGETKYGVQRLADTLSKNNVPAVAIHGNKSQSQRERALKAFKSNSVKVMVATDVAARGLDIPNVSHVINFDQPNTYEDYVHRIGRTGRASSTGKALTFVDPARR